MQRSGREEAGPRGQAWPGPTINLPGGEILSPRRLAAATAGSSAQRDMQGPACEARKKRDPPGASVRIPSPSSTMGSARRDRAVMPRPVAPQSPVVADVRRRSLGPARGRTDAGAAPRDRKDRHPQPPRTSRKLRVVSAAAAGSWKGIYHETLRHDCAARAAQGCDRWTGHEIGGDPEATRRAASGARNFEPSAQSEDGNASRYHSRTERTTPRGGLWRCACSCRDLFQRRNG